MEKNQYDASSIDFSRCDMDGAALCSCAPEELRLVFGPLGDQLYSQLWDLSESRHWCHWAPGLERGGLPPALNSLAWEAGQGLAPEPKPRSAWLWEGPGAPGQGAQPERESLGVSDTAWP